MTKIIAFSGKKQSGKTTATNFLFGIEMLSIQEPKLIDYFRINDAGKLIVPAKHDDEVVDSIFDPITPNESTIQFLATNIWPYIKQYNFADVLKQRICIGLLGLSWNQCYGSDDDKNTETKYKWEDMPGVITSKTLYSKIKTVDNVFYHEKGVMSARDIMQYVGTKIFRKIYGDIWVEACINHILSEQPEIAVIGDCRFPNEVKAIQDAGGVVVRLTRNRNSEDTDVSETALDEYHYDWKNFNAIVDNENMTIKEQNMSVYNVLTELGVLNCSIETREGQYSK